MSSVLEIPLSGSIDGSVSLPGSKSVSNRALLTAGLADGTSSLQGVLDSDDTFHMIQALKRLGVEFLKKENQLLVTGVNGKFAPYSEEIYIENAGTAARFLTAALCLGQGKYFLTGNQRMRQRPISDLLEALNSLGVKAVDVSGSGCPPVKITAEGLPGGEVDIRGGKSSQFVSALMLAAPYAKQKTLINIKDDLVSPSYVKLTEKIMKSFTVECRWKNERTLSIDPRQAYKAADFTVEADASSATYFWGMAAVTQGVVKTPGLPLDSAQGDLKFLKILEKMGCEVRRENDEAVVVGKPLRGVEADMNDMSDAAPTLAVVALFAQGETIIKNAANLRIKECDRISALATELAKLGAEVEEREDGLKIKSAKKYNAALLNTYDDHRMAMAFSLAGLKIPGVKIHNPQCVSKTFPDFFQLFFSTINNERS